MYVRDMFMLIINLFISEQTNNKMKMHIIY